MSKNNKGSKKQPLPNKSTTQSRQMEVISRMKRKHAMGKGEKTICLTMIVKNEEKNMVRLLDSLKPIIDYGSIVDTGSTDNTIAVIKKWSTDNGIDIKVHSQPFRDFGYNRSHSFIMAKRSFPDADYALLSDADFVWEIDVNHKFDKRLLIDEVYKVEQYNSTMKYDNIRLLKMSLDFVCKLRTHEYWRAGDERYGENFHHTTIKTLRIHDIEDGGCKADKYERDERLLLEDIADAENSKMDITRAKFYLAQTYLCLDRYEDSIKWYQERIADGGWDQEIYYSLCQIGTNYEKWGWKIKHCVTLLEKKKKEEKNEEDEEKEEISEKKKKKKEKEKKDDMDYLSKWNKDNLDKDELLKQSVIYFTEAAKYYMDAYKNRPSRAESIYKCTKMFRLLDSDEMRRKAYEMAVIGKKIPMTKDTLFVEADCYDYLFDFEISICAWYFPELRDEGREALSRLLDHDDLPDNIEEQVKANSRHYI